MAAAQIAAAPGEFLFDPDPALVAAELVGAFANERRLATLGPGSIYLTGDHDFASPLVPAFRVVAQFSVRAAAVAKELAARGIGSVEIKTRGVAYDPQQFRRSLKLRGDGRATIFLTRVGARETAILAERVSRE